MFGFDQIPMPVLGLTGLESCLSDEERAVQAFAHQFALEVMRPVGMQLDRMDARQVTAPESPLWQFLDALRDAGFLDLDTLTGMDDRTRSRLLPLVIEELGWGDAGLASLALAQILPALAAHGSGRADLIERFGRLPGCWLASPPEYSSDLLGTEGSEVLLGSKPAAGNLLVVRDGDELVINGRSTAWISGAPLAACGLLQCPGDLGAGLHRDDGKLHQVLLLVPFDLPGVFRDAPVDKLGLRALPTGAVYFDEVRVPKSFLLASGSAVDARVFGVLTLVNAVRGPVYTGVARAAFEQAMIFVHRRQQSVADSISHQPAEQARLFSLWQRLEAMRALSQRVFAFTFGNNGPHALASVTGKTFVTQQCFDLVNEVLQLSGDNGLSREFPLEKLLRDARMGLMEGGENQLLSLKGAGWLSQWYRTRK